ncbi:MAG: hypothetical protein QM729_12975 [Solirubrobacterales bacterium]
MTNSRYAVRGRRMAAVGLASLAGLATALAGAPAPAAATTWKPIGTSGQLDISDEIGLARTGDGTLHVGWYRLDGPAGYDLLQTPITAAGAIRPAVPIVSGWTIMEGPTLLAHGSTLQAFWSGVHTTVTGDPTEGVDQATSGDGGDTWAVSPTAIAAGDFAYGRDAAVVQSGSTLLQSWSGTSQTVVHAGSDPAVPGLQGYGVGVDQSLAASASGQVVVAWCASVDGPTGVFARSVDPGTGGPLGRTSTASRAFCPASGRVPLVARSNGGFYVLSTDADRQTVGLWRVGAARKTRVSGGSGIKEQLALAGDAEGRLWAGWIEGDQLVLRRSCDKRGSLRFGAAVRIPLPAGQTIYQLDLAAQADRVDAIARGSDGTTVRLFHTQAYPGLSLAATGGKRASFTVTDACRPVAGARIAVAGSTLTTDASGRASVDLPAGRFTAKASKPDYVPATATVRLTS